jgi:hypothetical protein
MAYKTAAKNLMLDALRASIATASLHTGFPATDGNELTGGSPAYARKAIAFNAATGGSIDDTATAKVFDVPAGVTVSAVAYRASDGTILADSAVTAEVFAAQGTYTLNDVDLDLNAT